MVTFVSLPPLEVQNRHGYTGLMSNPLSSSPHPIISLDQPLQHPALESMVRAKWEAHPEWAQPNGHPTFSIVIPPPNVTGTLHIGHALQHTLIDILVRTERLKGHSVLWVPGTDHAGIGTQTVVEKALAAEGHPKSEWGRDAFLQRVWEWKAQYGGTITSQMRQLGISVDWSRERFTMDTGCSQAVQEAFIRLYHQGLIYRGFYIVNWCPRCLTALSDIEVNHHETDGHLWHIRYPLYHDNHRTITVATTRPETLFGDQAVAVHPDDPRYRELIGQSVRVPISGQIIPIVADDTVDPTFGSGAVKITPAHDANDYETAQRHGLSPRWIMNETGYMINCPPPYEGLSRERARQTLVDALSTEGYLDAISPHSLNRAECYKCQTVIEPYLSKQWFVAMSKLAPRAMAAVANGDIEIIPPRFEKPYVDWMENIRDWCISRQIWWGHRIPVWYDTQDPEHMVVAASPPNDGRTYTQDPDVLDTWFSSALWPFSTMGWPENTSDMATFYPTHTLVTGYDIITFWVSRMIAMGLALTDQVPFKRVVVHGLVRDQHGKKMSKSFGNVVNPLDLMTTYGTDALRFSLARLATMGGQDIRYSDDKVEAAAHFVNKVWNAARFVMMGVGNEPLYPLTRPTPHHVADRWILGELDDLIVSLNQGHATAHFAQTADRLWEFIWNRWCDWYLEMSKCHKGDSSRTLVYTLTQSLILLHPIMPFVTEAIWDTLLKHPQLAEELPPSISLAPWPSVSPNDHPEMPDVQAMKAVVTELRRIRKEVGISPGKGISVRVVAPPTEQQWLMQTLPYIQKLAKVDQLTFSETLDDIPQSATGVVDRIELKVPLADVIDWGEERRRLEKKQASVAQALAQVTDRLAQPGFIAKAPDHVISKMNEQKNSLSAEWAALSAQLERIP